VQRLLTAVSPQVTRVGQLEDREMFEVDILSTIR